MAMVGIALGAAVTAAGAAGAPAATTAQEPAATTASEPTATTAPRPAATTVPEPAASPEGTPRVLGAPRDVVDYELHATLDPGLHTVHGEGTIVFRNVSSLPVGELYFHLYLNAFKNDRTLFLRAPVASGRGTGPVSDWGYIEVKKLVARELDGVDLWPGADKTSPGDPEDQTDIRVPLPRAVAPGELLTLDVDWDDKLPQVVERTGYAGSFHMVAQWFPKIAKIEPDGTFAHFAFSHLGEFYADFGRYDVTLDVPDGFVVGATGERVSESHRNGRTVVRYVQGDIHDFAWTAWDQFVERTAEAQGVRIRSLSPPGFGALTERSLETAKFGLRSFGEAYGPYPYKVLTIVHPPEQAREAGGMEYPTLITTGGPWWEPHFLHGIESVTLHEFGHQYFYGLLASDEERWPLLDEGINSYAEAKGLGELLGKGSALDLGRIGGLTVSSEVANRTFAAAVGHDEPVAQPAGAFASGSDYGGLVYARTATILATMAGVYGEDAMARALGRYAREFRFKHPDMQDFLELMRKELGDEADRNLRSLFFERGWVDYRVANAVSRRVAPPAGIFDQGTSADGGVSDAGIVQATPPPPADDAYEGWALVERHGTIHLPVEIELRSEDGTVRRVSWDGGTDWARIPYSGKSPLRCVRVDPEAKILLDQDLFNNGFCIESRRTAWRTLERALYLAELFLSGALP